MTFLDLQNSTAYYLDDLQFGYFTPTQVKLWINNAQREVQKRLLKSGNNYYNKCVQTSLVLNQPDYVIPSDFKKVMRLYLVISGTPPNETTSDLNPITTNQMGIIPPTAGTPSFYRFKRNRLVLDKYPDTAYLMRLEYAYEVSDMVLDLDLPDVPTAYQELIPLLAAEDGFIKDGRASALLEKKLASFQRDMDSDAQERNQDVPRGIVETGQFGIGGDFY